MLYPMLGHRRQRKVASTKSISSGLDEKDLKIMECVIGDPKVSVASIAKQVSVPESTVQKRLSELIQEKRLERVLRVADWENANYPLRYRVDLEINQPELSIGHGGPHDDDQKIDTQKKLALYIKDILPKAFKGLVVVEDVTILLGQRSDLCVTVRARDHHVILEFVTNGLRNLRGIQKTATAQEAWSCIDGDL